MTLHRTLAFYSACIAIALSSTVTLAAPDYDHASYQADNHGPHAVHSKQPGPQIDEKRVRTGIEKHRGLFSHAGQGSNSAKHFAKGKKLPNGVPAHLLDHRVSADLPQYKGYEWRSVGTDLILISVATGIIYEVFHHALN